MRQAPPEGRVKELLLSHLFNKDLLIREFAIRAAGMHWEMEEAYPILIAFAKDNSLEEEIVQMALASLDCYALSDETKRKEVSQLMADYFRHPKWSLRSKIYIYDSFLHLNSYISDRELGVRTARKQTKGIDYDLVDKIMSSFDLTQTVRSSQHGKLRIVK